MTTSLRKMRKKFPKKKIYSFFDSINSKKNITSVDYISPMY